MAWLVRPDMEGVGDNARCVAVEGDVHNDLRRDGRLAHAERRVPRCTDSGAGMEVSARTEPVPTRPTTVLLGVAAATLLAVQIAAAQGPIRDTGAVGPALMTQILNGGAAPSHDDAVTRGPSEGDDVPAPGAELPVPAPRPSPQPGAATGLTIIPVFDSTITSDPNAAAIENTINTAIANIQSMFSDPITVTINFGTMNTGLGQSSTYYYNLSYSTFLAALKADSKTSDDATAIANLPSVSTNPVNGSSTINVKTANLRAVGIAANPPPGKPDGFVTLNTLITSPGSPGTTGAYVLLPVVEHEIDEVLGFGSSLPDIVIDPSAVNGTIFPEDLFRYDQSGARTLTITSGALAFFSIDSSTDLAQFHNQFDGADFGDWESNPLPPGALPKVQDAYATPGANPALSVELTALDVIGYDRISRARRSMTRDGDFDGDGKADITVYRPATGVWYVLRSGTNYSTYTGYQWGVSSDLPVPVDYDGDGKTDIAIYRPATGSWYILLSSTNFATYVSYQWGVSTDIPVPRDYDGDGKADVAVYRPATGSWYILLSSTNFATYVSYQWGVSTDIPVPADYDGDGKTDVAIYRPATGAWYILLSSTNFATYVSYQWGVSTDIPVPADYDGDGKTDIAIFRPATGNWYTLLSSTNYASYVSYQWGVSSDIPVLRRP